MLTINSSSDDFTKSLDLEKRSSGLLRTLIGCLLINSIEKQKISKGGSLTSGRFVDIRGSSSGFDQDVCDFLREEVSLKISKSVVSLLLFDGCTNILVCSGIPIESNNTSMTRILTSEMLGATFITRRDAGRDMKIQVRDASDNVATGWLEQNYLSRGFTLVNVKQFLDVRAIHLHDEVEILPGSNLVGIELMGGKQTSRRGIMTKDSSTSDDGIELSYSTCKISKAGDGGPLFDCDGNFAGMNLWDPKVGAFMRRSVIIEKLEQFESSIRLLESRIFRVRRMSTPRFHLLHGGRKHDLLEEDLNSLGYPKPSTDDADRGMVLANTFEEPFGDPYDSSKGVWGILSETISKELSQSVVSLASYNGETRFFACSGIITRWNGCATILTSASLVRNRRDESKIHENLRIDVLLPDKQRTEGTLQHCHLHYNVAIVSFKGSHTSIATDIYDPMSYKYSEVVAVGRVFESGMLMATGGRLLRASSERRFDCTDLFYSSCEITKAGIGGPLVDFEGKFVGMNFYDEKEGTPYLPQSSILEVLSHFEKKRIFAETDDDGCMNRWPVPKPLWRCPGDHHRNEDKVRIRVASSVSSSIRQVNDQVNSPSIGIGPRRSAQPR